MDELNRFTRTAQMMKQARIDGMKLARTYYDGGEFDAARKLVHCCRYANKRMLDWMHRAKALQLDMLN